MGCITSKSVTGPKNEINFYMEFKLGKKLGEGAFGQVRIAIDRSTKQEYAVKIVDVRERDETGACTGGVNKNRERVTNNEINLWQKASSSKDPHIVQLYRSFAEKSLYYMVCEKCQCSFMDRLVDSDTMSESSLAKIFNHMLKAIVHVNACQIVHRDIKPDNFLWGGKDNEILKLCDFGLAVALPANGGKLHGVFGTAPYMAPEMLKGDGYDALVDVWSVGAVAYLMVFGNFPYSPAEASAAAMKEAILQDNPPLSFPSEDDAQGVVSGSLSAAVDFTKALLCRPPGSRPNAEKALQHDFVQLDKKAPKEKKVTLPSEEPQAEEPLLRRNVGRARTLTQKLKEKPSPTVQNGIDDLLKKLIVKTGGDISSSNLFFSEGENQEKEAEEDRPAAADADSRIIMGITRRTQRHGTHSGVISEKSQSGAGGISPRQLVLKSLSSTTATASPKTDGSPSVRTEGPDVSPKTDTRDASARSVHV